MNRDLPGEVAVVTGGSRGFGLAVAELLAARGAAVRTLARATNVDVTERAAVERAIASFERDAGPITLLVNNAGTLDAVGPFWQIDPDVWWREVETHLRGAALCSHAVLPSMVDQGRGRIVNVVGLLGQAGDGYATAYACAKAALVRLTELLTVELEGTGVRAFCISPGAVRTAMTEGLASTDEGRRWLPEFAELAETDGWLSPQVGAELIARIATGELDPLAGRFVHVNMDVDALLTDADAIRESERLLLRITQV
jgi:NAD(P)-dependent dehydrogenase (short-subunit alcohol dehydrogenase family)